ncbi:Hypothetical predicted protein [Mytilus galloprovincialis]|uniref:Integrase catalytic domain-containing protein n=1 Tax=Mytilus galloprovincialis TaxID=29158 RepID=A0A8B6D7U2_MYTGA|nr:Hypothetical predicted protein [Mytilus galloprovincialis]
MAIVETSSPMERLATDILGELSETENGNRYILVVSDYYTKWTESFPMPNMEASTVVKIIVEEVIARFGVPSWIHSDQGRQYESRLFQVVCKVLDIKKTRTTPYHPQSDGKKNITIATRSHTISTLSVNNTDTEVWNCKICNKEFSEENDRIVQCEYCAEYYCSKCLNLSKVEYESFKNPALHWFCPSCDSKVMKNIKSDREIEERCSEFMKKMEDRITSFESEMKTKVNPEQVKEILETVIGTDKLPVVRKRADTLVVSQLVNYLETDAEGIKNVVRIGKREENAEKPRPMKVTLENVDIKKKLMKNLTKLKAVDKESQIWQH